MALMDAWKSSFEGFTKSLGGSVAALVWSSLVVGGPIAAWFASPAVYSIQLTRIQAAAFALALVLVIALTAWATRSVVHRRRKFHLTPIGQINAWGSTGQLTDGTYNVQITAQFVARNLTDSVQRLIVAKMVRPRIEGVVLNSFIDGPGGSVMELRADAAKPMTVHMLIKCPKELKAGDRDALFEILNDEGHPVRVNVTLRDMTPSRVAASPTGAASTASTAATTKPSP